MWAAEYGSRPSPGRQWKELGNSVADTVLDEPHGLPFPRTIGILAPRHQPAADPARQWRGAVRLSGQPFHQPRARQHLDGGAGQRRLLAHAVLAIAAGHGRVLYRLLRSHRPRHLGAIRAAALPLERVL